MLRIELAGGEQFDQTTSTFIDVEPRVLHLEHSLVSVSKWESEFEIPFLANTDKTREQLLYYVYCMVLEEDAPFDSLKLLTQEQVDQINSFIDKKHSATTFGDLPKPRPGRQETITSELVYYWMVAFQIPFECETWNLNRLFSLIQICNVKQNNGKTKSNVSNAELARRRQELNEKRKKELGTSG